MDLCDVSEVGSRSNSLEEQRISLSWQGERAGVFGEGRRVEDVYSSLAAMHHPSCIAAGAFGPYSAASVAIAAYSIVNRVRPEELAHTIDEDSSVHPTGVDGVDLMSDSVQTNGAVGALPYGSAAAPAIPDQAAAASDQEAESSPGQAAASEIKVRPEELAHTTASPAALGSTTDESSSVHPTGVEEELDDDSSEYTTDSEDREDAVAGNHIVAKVVAGFPDIFAWLLVGIIAEVCIWICVMFQK